MDEFVKKLVPDPKSPPDTLLLCGYLGASSEDNHTRLYFDMELASYVEIPNEAILHTTPMPADQGGLGGSYVWIKRDAEVIHGKVGAERPKAKFFEGPIMQQFSGAAAAPAAPEAAAAGPGAAQPEANSQLAFCLQPSVLQVCIPASRLCFSRQWNCRSRIAVCNSWIDACPSALIQCETVICPVETLTCPATLDCPLTLNCPVTLDCPINSLACGFQSLACGIGPGLPGVGPVMGAEAAGLEATTQTAPCVVAPSQQVACQTLLQCPTVIQWQCPTRIVWQCPTRVPLQCPTRAPWDCPSVVPLTCRTRVPWPCPPPTLTGPNCLSVLAPCITQQCTIPPQCPIETLSGACPVVTQTGCPQPTIVCGGIPGGPIVQPQEMAGMPMEAGGVEILEVTVVAPACMLLAPMQTRTLIWCCQPSLLSWQCRSVYNPWQCSLLSPACGIRTLQPQCNLPTLPPGCPIVTQTGCPLPTIVCGGVIPDEAAAPPQAMAGAQPQIGPIPPATQMVWCQPTRILVFCRSWFNPLGCGSQMMCPSRMWLCP
jgi:hypothetical protein